MVECSTRARCYHNGVARPLRLSSNGINILTSAPSGVREARDGSRLTISYLHAHVAPGSAATLLSISAR